ncbi:hypothetical protein PVAP13_4NG288414 [Panicum virgatum]|uniref:Uncharacterized protein n=1 Tax=Panicum virgatum TaxID=38727 RepID=A0A8T0TGE0_PANVG|nr:hypothetical protein PVAP13_4NG288414 [Panicum virgatum]
MPGIQHSCRAECHCASRCEFAEFCGSATPFRRRRRTALRCAVQDRKRSSGGPVVSSAPARRPRRLAPTTERPCRHPTHHDGARAVFGLGLSAAPATHAERGSQSYVRWMLELKESTSAA